MPQTAFQSNAFQNNGFQVEADFEVVVISGNGVSDDIATRSLEHQTFARNHYWNSLADLVVELKRR